MSLFLGAVGAILRFAVSVHTTGFNVHMIGVILMIVGAIGAVTSLLFWNTWGGIRRTGETPSPGAVVVEQASRPRTVVTTEREVR